MRTNFLKIRAAVSFKNGIAFRSNNHKGYFAVATVDDDGNIKTEWTNNLTAFVSRPSEGPNKTFIKAISYAISFILAFAFVSSFWKPMLGIRLFFLTFVMLYALALFINIRSTNPNITMFHSAEHMSLNAYNHLKKVPNLEEVQNYSRFHNDCGTNKITSNILSSFVCFLCTFLPIKYIIIGIIISPIVVELIKKCGLLNSFQKFTTSTPTDRELLVGIEGIKLWIENEEKPKGYF